MEIVSATIHRLRKENNVTQETFGKAIGVTAQAVSNWECGGMPDVSLLPAIADYFGVSIDALFGRDDLNQDDLERELICDLFYTKREERFEKAYKYCCSIQKGLAEVEPATLETMFASLDLYGEVKANCVIAADEGVAAMNINHNNRDFFMMPRPEGGYKEKLLDSEKYEKFFAELGQKDCMKALLFIYSRPPYAFSISKFSKDMKLDEKRAVDLLERLCKLHLLQVVKLEKENDVVDYYKRNDFSACDHFLIPLLCAASELIENSTYSFSNHIGENKTLL